MHCAKPSGKQRFNAAATNEYSFLKSLEDALLTDLPKGNVLKRLKSLSVTQGIVLKAFGGKLRMKQDQFETNPNELNAVMELKRVDLLKKKHQSAVATLQVLRPARNITQKTAR